MFQSSPCRTSTHPTRFLPWRPCPLPIPQRRPTQARLVPAALQDQAAHAKGAPVYAPFFALVLSETVSVLDTNTEGLMRLLLPYVTRGVASDNPSYRAASFIVLGAACRCRALNITAAETLLEAALTGVGPELATQAAMLVVAVCHAGVKQLSGKTLWAVARLPGLPRELASLSAAGVPVSCVLLAVSAGLAQGALHHHEFQTLVRRPRLGTQIDASAACRAAAMAPYARAGDLPVCDFFWWPPARLPASPLCEPSCLWPEDQHPRRLPIMSTCLTFP